MRANQLIDILRISQIANLAARVHPVLLLASQSVPESYATISSSAATTHDSVLMRIPCNRFDSCNVLIELGKWLGAAALLPDQQLVVIAA